MSDRDGVMYRERSRSNSIKRDNNSPVNNGRPRDQSRSRTPEHRMKEDRASRSPSRQSRRVSMKDYRASSSNKHSERDRASRSERDRSDRGGERPRYKSRTRSRSPRKYKSSRYSRSRSRSYSGGGRYTRSRSHSPMSSRRRHTSNREKPSPTRCLGVFGLSRSTTESQLYHIFSKYGPVEKVVLVIDAKIGRSRGFGFVYFENMDDAKMAKEACSGMEIDGRCIRVDFSITQRAHTPTPGIYMGKPTYIYDRWNERRRSDRDDYYGGSSGDRYRSSHRDRRSPSPRYRSRRYERSRSRSYSPHKYRIKRRDNG